MTDPTPVVADLLADAWDEGAADVSDQTPTAPKGPPMPDLTPDATTTPNFDPGRVAIVSGWLVYDVGHHTCGGYGPGSGYVHEPGCGLEGIVEVAALPALLDAAAERDRLAAKLDAVRALAEHYAGLTNVDAGSAILRAIDAGTGGES